VLDRLEEYSQCKMTEPKDFLDEGVRGARQVLRPHTVAAVREEKAPLAYLSDVMLQTHCSGVRTAAGSPRLRIQSQALQHAEKTTLINLSRFTNDLL